MCQHLCFCCELLSTKISAASLHHSLTLPFADLFGHFQLGTNTDVPNLVLMESHDLKQNPRHAEAPQRGSKAKSLIPAPMRPQLLLSSSCVAFPLAATMSLIEKRSTSGAQIDRIRLVQSMRPEMRNE